MKLTVKTLKGSHFEIRAQPTDTIIAVKKNIEDIQGKDNCPCGQQLLIYHGKVLKDETTLAENKVTEDGFLVVMLSKPSSTSARASDSTSLAEAPSQPPAPHDTDGQAASNLALNNNREQTIQHIMEIGGGIWDKATVMRALQAAYDNPEQAVDYLYSGIPETTEVGVPVGTLPANQAGVVPSSREPNSSPLDLFPQEVPSGAGAGNTGSLDFLRNNQQFQALRNLVHTNPQILQPMLQELGKQNPQILRQIQENHAEFLQLLSEPIDASDRDLFGQPEQDVTHSISVTPAEDEAVRRLQAMGFDRALVIEAFLACDRNEELAANYLLENAGEYED